MPPKEAAFPWNPKFAYPACDCCSYTMRPSTLGPFGDELIFRCEKCRRGATVFPNDTARWYDADDA